MDFVLPGEYVYRGITFCAANKHVDIDMMKDWHVRPSDVLIATPPKSGTTWIGEILRQMRAYHPEANGSEVSMFPPFVELELPHQPSALGCQDQMPSPRIIKTHLPYEFMKQKVEQEGLKVVVLLREPKDTITSFYYHYCMKMAFSFAGDFHQFFELVRQDRLFCGNIFTKARDWWQARHLPNVLVVKYEEMKKDTAEVVYRIAQFLGIPLDQEKVDAIIERSSMTAMSKAMTEAAVDEDGKPVFDDVDKFFRKGIVGDWKNVMRQDEVDFVDECVRKYYDPVGLNFNV
ncbi:hypothetical protein CAPTEDRAFT_177998 [Capitella teleta]|uniref:Sulfotransferase domain-containing protein n=1 Tax=Capitella teleta TaxID=283909 RepID=R7UCF2_CAPTE|nr:hypothetical protein CAPTEDRAFT_177998 [Capitella teleta]|eukprot:ELU03684.1 hypothetical protein CAPTEDRAFT_177998 [Capitella teleta]